MRNGTRIMYVLSISSTGKRVHETYKEKPKYFPSGKANIATEIPLS